MDSNYVEPLAKSIENVFATLLQTPVQAQPPTHETADDVDCDVSGIIGMSGDVNGALVLSFPMATAQRVANLFVGMDVDPKSEDFSDAIGELVNIVAGNTKAEFTGKKVSISCPSVVLAQGHEIRSLHGAPTVQLICESDFGVFVAEFTLAAAEQTAGAPDAAAA